MYHSNPWYAPLQPSVQHKQPVLSISWSSAGLSNNELLKMINGNRMSGYNIGMWNCRKGLINGDKKATHKKVEVIEFIQKRNLHILGLVEADLHGGTSRESTH